jgi:glycosyltransferase involved in cell wall biosynthesis
MYNFWFAIEDPSAATLLGTGIKQVDHKEVNATWLPAADKPGRPFTNLLGAVGQVPANAKPDALFYEAKRDLLPVPSLLRRVPTLVSLDSATLCPFWCDLFSPEAISNNSILQQQTHRYFQPERLAKENETLKLAAGFVVWSEWAKRHLVKVYGISSQKVAVIRNGVDLASWDATVAGFHATQPKNKQLPERVRLLFVGNEFQRLGGDLLLSVLDNNPVLASRYELHLVMTHTAAANLGTTLKRSNVFVHTHGQNQQAGAEFYLNADIFVLPAHYETNPALLATALASGLPIIASHVDGLTELVKDGKNGLLVEPNSSADLALAITQLVNDPEMRENLGKASRLLAEAEFDPTKNAHQVLTFLKQLTTEARSQQYASEGPPLQHFVNNFSTMTSIAARRSPISDARRYNHDNTI